MCSATVAFLFQLRPYVLAVFVPPLPRFLTAMPVQFNLVPQVNEPPGSDGWMDLFKSVNSQA